MKGPHRNQFRFFLDPQCFVAGKVEFPDDTAHQIRRVFRLQVGDRVIAIDNQGVELLVELIGVGEDVTGRVIERRSNVAEPRIQVHLYAAVTKAKKLELVVQKCTEIGIASVTPVLCTRSIAGSPGELRGERLREIAREAAEQSGRGRIPAVMPATSFAQALSSASVPSLLFSGAANAHRLRTIEDALRGFEIESVGVFVGPEGGFTDSEIDLAQADGLSIVSLGPRTLRAETAAIVASALILHFLESTHE